MATIAFLAIFCEVLSATKLPECQDSRFPEVFGSRGNFVTEYLGVDIHEIMNNKQLKVVVAVGSIRDPALILDED